MTLAEKQERIAAIENLLTDYEALPLNQHDRRAEFRLRNRLGNLLLMLGSHTAARQHVECTLTIARELKDLYLESIALGNLGIVYRQPGRLVEAEKCYRQSLEISREFGSRIGEGRTLNNLGNIYGQQGRLVEAEKCYQQSLEISREIGDLIGEGRTLRNLAFLREAQEDLAGALEFGQQAVVVLEMTENIQMLTKAKDLVTKLKQEAEKQRSQKTKG
ncbi:MAG: tetratricopeptide repeat protein [Ignavibacteriales bacterium]